LNRCIDFLCSSFWFGVRDVNPLLPRSYHNLTGLRKLVVGMELRKGLFYRLSFWRRWWGSLWEGEPTLFRRLRRLFINFISLLTFLPISVPLIPLFSALSDLIRCRVRISLKDLIARIVISVGVIFFGFLLAFLAYQSILIYSKFFVFSLTSIIFNYRQSLNIVMIITGSITFVITLHSQVKSKYINLKLLTFAAAKTLHEAKLAEMKESEAESTEESSESNPTEEAAESNDRDQPSVSSVRGLVWMSPMGLPYIPKRLFMRVIEDVNPVGPERAQIVIKLAIMTVFVVFVHFVMTTLSMSDVDSAWGGRNMVTIFAVAVPSLVTSLQSAEMALLETEQNTYLVNKIVENFLKENPDKFY